MTYCHFIGFYCNYYRTILGKPFHQTLPVHPNDCRGGLVSKTTIIVLLVNVFPKRVIVDISCSTSSNATTYYEIRVIQMDRAYMMNNTHQRRCRIIADPAKNSSTRASSSESRNFIVSN